MKTNEQIKTAESIQKDLQDYIEIAKSQKKLHILANKDIMDDALKTIILAIKEQVERL